MTKKTYVITGAGSGIGLELVRALAQDDNTIFAGYRSEKSVEDLKNISGNIFPFYVDYDKPETIKPATEFIKSNCNHIDTLVNGAGCVVAGPVEIVEMDEIRHQFNVNILGHIELTQGLVDYLDNGRIINISSMASFGLFPFISPYCVSKRALDMFFNTFLIENKRNIKVISIKPGIITTPLWEKSVKANIKYLGNCKDYEKEMELVIRSARKSETNGSKPQDVVNVILKADAAKKPKLSYTVGNDALMAYIVSKLPQKIINHIIKTMLKSRLR